MTSFSSSVTSYLSQGAVEVCHLCTQLVAKLAQDLFVPRVILHVDLGLYLAIVYHDRTKLLACLRIVECSTGLPGITVNS